jgi:hypothetical protein
MGGREETKDMADLGGLGDKAKDMANSEQGEKASDAGIDKAGDAADKASGGKFGDKIDAGQDAADKKVGDE